MEISTLELTASYGSGDGSGYGDGYGYGYGYGYGDGYGDGDGEKVYLDALLSKHRIPGATVAFWRCTKDNTPANGGSGTKAVLNAAEKIAGPLKLCGSGALHGTQNPRNWKGSHWWIVALHEPTKVDGDKIGSLQRTFLENLGKCPF